MKEFARSSHRVEFNLGHKELIVVGQGNPCLSDILRKLRNLTMFSTELLKN